MTSDSGIDVRLVTPEEAGGLIELIRRCYGDTYIDPSFYDVDCVRERLETSSLHSIGAFTATGQLVGHMGISVRSPRANTADAGMTLVDPAFRGQGIARRVAGGLATHAVAIGLVGVHDYPVTVHAATQRIGADFGVDTGLMLANVPADVVFREMDSAASTRRSSSLIRWLPFAPSPPRSVHLPPRYRAQIEALYSACYLDRTVMEAEEPMPDVPSDFASSYDPRRQTLKARVVRSGADLRSRLAVGLEEATRRGALVAHVDLPLSQPSTPSAVADIRSLRFFFAGLLPEYRDGDVLRMQWVSDSVSVGEADAITSSSTRDIEAFVLEDRT